MYFTLLPKFWEIEFNTITAFPPAATGLLTYRLTSPILTSIGLNSPKVQSVVFPKVLAFDKGMSGEAITPEGLEQMGAVIHDEWLKRNDWVFDKEYGNPTLAVPYEQLPEDEKDKDKAQIVQALGLIETYKMGLTNIESICEHYHIESGKTL